MAKPDFPVVDAASFLGDFADLAAVLSGLDLLIGVDTAPVHLMGTLGRPVWVLLPDPPDWRWLLDRADSPWYPSARLFRQEKRGDWASVVVRAAEHLAAVSRPSSPFSPTPLPGALH